MRDRVCVFHLIKSLGRGGAETLLPEGLRYADQSKFEYRYGYFLPWKDAVVPLLQSQGADVHCFQKRSSLQILLTARRVASELRRHGVDVLHCHLPIAGVLGRLAGRLAGVPVVYSEHNKQERYHPLTRRMNLATWQWQSRAIAVSEDVAASVRAHVRSDVPLQVVLNGVDVNRFSRRGADAHSVRTRFGIAPDAPVVGTVAVFRVQKRLDHWLEAARRIHQQHPETHFLLVGDGPLRAEVEAQLEALALREVVHLPGLQEDVRPYLAAMDVYLMSSMFEGLPVALLEAMSMGCTPVCTSVGGIPEVIRPGENGLLAEPGQPAELAFRVAELIRVRGRLQALGAAARHTVERQFSMARMQGELERVYTEVAGRCGDGR